MIVRLSLRAPMALFFATVLVALGSPLAAQQVEKWSDSTVSASRADKPVALLVRTEICNRCRELEAGLPHAGFQWIVLDENEFPAVARAYRRAAQAFGVSGALPLVVVATPRLEPLAAFTAVDRQALTGDLDEAAARWSRDREGMTLDAGIALRRFRLNPPAAATDTTAEEIVRRLREALRADDRTRAEALTALRTLTDSSLFDQLGGGLHDRALDEAMTVPAFEKSLDAQSELTLLAIEAWRISGDPRFAEVAKMTATAIIRDFRELNAFLFYSGLQSKSLVPRGRPQFLEGGLYSWEAGEVRRLLGDAEADLFFFHYGIKADGNVPRHLDRAGDLEGRNVLSVVHPPASEEVSKRLASAREKLLEVRLNRPPAPLDERIVTSSNARVITALARAALTFGEPSFAEAAERGARALLNARYDASRKTLRRLPAVAATDEDFASLVAALLDVYSISFDPLFLERAVELQQRHDALFWQQSEGRFDSERGVPSAVAGLSPPDNALHAANLARLADLLGSEPMRLRARALGAAERNHRQLLIVGSPNAVPTQDLLAAVSDLRGEAAVIMVRTPRERARLQSILPYVAVAAECPVATEKGRHCPPFALVCVDGKCGTPTGDPARFRALAGSAAAPVQAQSGEEGR
jgi:uncharacterized protein YyaL (SSP411 family)